MIEIEGFVPHAPVPADIIDEYRGRVPDHLIEIWERYGYGTFGGGLLRTIDPRVYEAEVGDCIGKTQGDGIAIPIMVTGFGDLITWEPSVSRLVGILYRYGETVSLGRVRSFVELAQIGGVSNYYPSALNWDLFVEAVATHGGLPYEQSFVFVPLLSLGGPEKVENLHKRDTIASIQLAVDFQGLVEH